MLQGFDRKNAFALIDRFNSGEGRDFVFHFTNKTAARQILADQSLRATRHGMGGAGLYVGTLPKPNFFQRFFAPVGWGLNPGSNVRIPILMTETRAKSTSQPLLPRWTRIVGKGENVPLISPE